MAVFVRLKTQGQRRARRREALAAFRGEPQERKLPTAPRRAHPRAPRGRTGPSRASTATARAGWRCRVGRVRADDALRPQAGGPRPQHDPRRGRRRHPQRRAAQGPRTCCRDRHEVRRDLRRVSPSASARWPSACASASARAPVVVVSAFSKVTDLLVRGAQPGPGPRLGLRERRLRDPRAPPRAIDELVPRGPSAGPPPRPPRTRPSPSCARSTRGVYHLAELTARTLDAISGDRRAPLLRDRGRRPGRRGHRRPGRRRARRDRHRRRPSAAPRPSWRRRGRRRRARSSPLVDDRQGPRPARLHRQHPQGRGHHARPRRQRLVGGGPGRGPGRGGDPDLDGRGRHDDGRSAPGARARACIPEVSFDEAAELAYFGAKVLHPATIKPAVERGIPVRILNSLRPEAPGHADRGRGSRAASAASRAPSRSRRASPSSSSRSRAC